MGIRMQMSGLRYTFCDVLRATIVEINYRGHCEQYVIPFDQIVWC